MLNTNYLYTNTYLKIIKKYSKYESVQQYLSTYHKKYVIIVLIFPRIYLVSSSYGREQISANVSQSENYIKTFYSEKRKQNSFISTYKRFMYLRLHCILPILS